jgi:chain length determinant protein (polysaccharide antigen chain regulator)
VPIFDIIGLIKKTGISIRVENNENRQTVTLQLLQADSQENEISLYELSQTLVRFKLFIVFLTLFCTLAALAYAFNTPPVYQAKAYLLYPKINDIEGLNLLDSKNTPLFEKTYSPQQVFGYFIESFNSRSIRMRFFKQNDVLSSLTDANEPNVNISKIFEYKFHQLLRYTVEESNNNSHTVILQAPEADLVTNLLNSFVEFADQEAIRRLKNDIQNSLTYRKESLLKARDRKRKAQISLNKDKVEELTEAYDIAEKMGIKYNSLPAVSDSTNSSKQLTNLNLNLQGVPLYFRGTNALSEEIKAIRNRKNDDAFIDGLRALELELDSVNSLIKQIASDESVNTVTVDQYASKPDNRISPKRKQIVMAGFILGLTLGIFFAFILNKIYREES